MMLLDQNRFELYFSDMATSTIRRNCKTCGQQRPFTKEKVNHVLHLILSVCTVGLWAGIVWLPLMILNMFKSWRCTFCGEGKIA